MGGAGPSAGDQTCGEPVGKDADFRKEDADRYGEDGGEERNRSGYGVIRGIVIRGNL